MPLPETTAALIRRLRRQLGENTAQFGARFHVSGRAVEHWEQGRRVPRPLVLLALSALDHTLNAPRALAHAVKMSDPLY